MFFSNCLQRLSSDDNCISKVIFKEGVTAYAISNYCKYGNFHEEFIFMKLPENKPVLNGKITFRLLNT